jgi:hypothetical protein
MACTIYLDLANIGFETWWEDGVHYNQVIGHE